MKQIPQDFTPIPSHPDYAVDKDGNVYSSKRNRLLKLLPHQQGYRYAKVDGKARSVHRLVATTYIPNPHNKREVNHINGIKDDNRVDNLEWLTPKENTQHAVDTGLVTHLSKLHEQKRRPVRSYHIATGAISEFESQKAAATALGFPHLVAKVGAVCLGNRKTCRGYRFEFITT